MSEDTSTDRVELSAMKAPELRELAKSLGVEKVFGVKNDVLRDQIAKAQAAAATAETDEEPKGETYTNGVFVPEGIEPGKDPGWPLYETEGGDWLPLDLTDEQRSALAAASRSDAVEGVELETGVGVRRVVVDSEGDYVAVEVNEQDPEDEQAGDDQPADAAGDDDPADESPEGTGEKFEVVVIESRAPITRQNDSAWWCPFCDTSMLHGIVRCPNCTAVREGDEAVRR